MGKLVTYALVALGMILLLNLAGFQTSSSLLLEKVGITFGRDSNQTATNITIGNINPDLDVAGTSDDATNMGKGYLWYIVGLVLVGVAVSVFAGFLSGGTALEGIRGIIWCGLGVMITGDLLSIIAISLDYARWLSIVVSLIILPLIYGLWISVFQVWGGGAD